MANDNVSYNFDNASTYTVGQTSQPNFLVCNCGSRDASLGPCATHGAQSRYQSLSSNNIGAINDRLVELENTNLNLRRMVELLAADPTRDGKKLLNYRESLRNSVGLPVMRSGRLGASWRHIKQTNNYSNTNLLFIDGGVRIDDTTRFPPNRFGYPPKARHFNAQSLNDFSLPLQRPVRYGSAALPGVKKYNNVFHEHARQGLQYWPRDDRLPKYIKHH